MHRIFVVMVVSIESILFSSMDDQFITPVLQLPFPDRINQKIFSNENQHENNDTLEDRLTQDMFNHQWVHNILIFFIRLSLEKFLGRRFGGQGQRRQGVHD